MKIFTLPDVTLTGGVDSVVSSSQPCRWYQIEAISLSAAARIGDSNVGASRGALLSPGGVHFSPPVTDQATPGGNYDLADVRVQGTGGDTVGVIYAI